MKQDILFNPARAGTVHNLCLDNVRRGFGIDNKYASAWEAWEHTQQHPDRNLPDGLDVPLFYSYTTDIDGVTQNYGHINVRLANGTVWSDGNIYPSIDGYLANHLPKYVGWGESVNDVKIIEGDNMSTITPEALQDFQNWKDWGTKAQAAMQAAGLEPNPPDLNAFFADLAGWKATGIKDEEALKNGINKTTVLDYLNKNLK